jgi:predicted GNAT family acetyltransferase
MTHEVRHNPERSRYELLIDDRLVGVADYRQAGDRVVLPHTEIDPSMRGRGLGDVLVRATLDDIRTTGRAVVPSCWFVAEFIDTHPEYRDLVAA